MNRPKLKKDIDFSAIIRMAEEMNDEIEKGDYYAGEDDPHYMWEEVMKALYGKDYFEWYNKNA